MEINKDFDRTNSCEIGSSVECGKVIMAYLRAIVVRQQCEICAWTKRFCAEYETVRLIKDYIKRTIRTVFGQFDINNTRILICRGSLPAFCSASAVLRHMCEDQPAPELNGLSARLGSLLPYRKVAAASCIVKGRPNVAQEASKKKRRETDVFALTGIPSSCAPVFPFRAVNMAKFLME